MVKLGILFDLQISRKRRKDSENVTGVEIMNKNITREYKQNTIAHSLLNKT